MKWITLLVPMFGLFLAADVPTAEAAPPEEASYAKVELKGTLLQEARVGGKVNSFVTFVEVRNDEYELDLSKVKEPLQQSDLEKLAGRTVLVTGTLDLKPSPESRSRSRPRVLVSTIKPVHQK
jgi:hypothetical protein